MTINETNPNHITAEPGMVFQRISDKQLFGTEIMLGYMHYIGGVLQDPPVLATPEHFEEVESPTENIDEIGESTTPDLQI